MLLKVLLITYRLTYGVVGWELFSVFSIFCIMPFGDCTLPQPQETTLKSVAECRAFKKFLSSRLIVNSRRFWDSHQRHKFLRAEASRDILKFRVSEIAFSGDSRGIFHRERHVFSSEYTQDLDQCRSKCPRRSTTSLSFKTGNRCFPILFDGAYFLSAVMVERDESSRLRMANQLAGGFGRLPALIDSPDSV